MQAPPASPSAHRAGPGLWHWFALVFAISIAFRLALALVNREANDLHLDVVGIIQRTGRLPILEDCWECFQPKLYYASLAALFQGLGIFGYENLILPANLISVLCGALTLALVWRFLWQTIEDGRLALLAFALTALNPNLISIHVQATNDSFVILFATLALYAAWLFLREWKVWQFAAAFVAVSLAVSSKTNGWIVYVTIMIALIAQAILNDKNRRRAELYALVFLAAVPLVAIFNPLNQYLVNYRHYRSPIVVCLQTYPLPHFSEETVVARPGILSLRDGYLTFKFASLLEHPQNVNQIMSGYPSHRTSFWTQLYGHAHSIHFDNWPASWATSDESLLPLLRVIYLLALAPTLLLMAGVLLQTMQFVRSVFRHDPGAAGKVQFGLFVIAFWGQLAFVFLYSLMYRDYAVIKAIFLFPAILAFPAAFLAAMHRLPRRAVIAVFAICIPLIGLYLIDVASLFLRLARG